LGENFPPDELNQILHNGSHFGFPHCHGRNIPLDSRKNCVGLVPSTFDLDPHCAALGMTFYSGSQFPEKFQNQIFIAEHGSWNKKKPSGYRISFLNRETGEYSTFIDGWLNSENYLDAWVCHFFFTKREDLLIY
jgi:glucose/arabinose dehydrogenase